MTWHSTFFWNPTANRGKPLINKYLLSLSPKSGNISNLNTTSSIPRNYCNFVLDEIDYLASVEAIVRYLRTVVFEYNEHVHCEMTKQSAEGVRQHMLDKTHGMISLERESELLGRWEFSDSDGHDTDEEELPKPLSQRTDTVAPRVFSQEECTLPSGRIIGSISKSRTARFVTRPTAFAAKDSSSGITTKGSVHNTDKTSPDSC
jgi:hypothetical protein